MNLYSSIKCSYNWYPILEIVIKQPLFLLKLNRFVEIISLVRINIQNWFDIISFSFYMEIIGFYLCHSNNANNERREAIIMNAELSDPEP